MRLTLRNMRASIASVTYFNRSQLARILSIAPATLTKRILAGSVTPDAHDGNGRELFDASLHAPRHPIDVTGYASGIVNNAELLHLTRLDNAATEPVAGTPANPPSR